MPTILTPQSQVGDLYFQNAVSDLLQTFCSQLLLTDTPVLSPTAGYKAYQKRMAFAKKASKNPKAYNPAGANLLENEANIGYNAVSVTSGRSIFEALAGITAEDYL